MKDLEWERYPIPEPKKIKHRWLLAANVINAYAVIYSFGLSIETDRRALVPAFLVGASLFLTGRALFKLEGWK